MKRFVSMMLAFVTVLTMTTVVFAQEPMGFVDENGIEYSTIYDKENNTVQAVLRDTNTGKYTYGPVVAVGVDTENPGQVGAEPRAKKIHQDTFLNFEYDIWDTNPREWRLERPNGIFSQYYFMCYENSSNSSELEDWKDDVDALNAQEFVVIGAVGLSVYEVVKAAITTHAAVATDGLLSGAAIDSIKNAVAAVGATGVAIDLLCTIYNNCAMSYKDVWKATDNYHYDD